METSVNYAWIGQMSICTMHNSVAYSLIGKNKFAQKYPQIHPAGTSIVSVKCDTIQSF